MPRCDVCGKNVSLPFHCQYCGKNFCGDHRLPPDHACSSLAAWKKSPAPGVGIRYGSGGTSAYGGGFSTAPQDTRSRQRTAQRISYLKIAAVVILCIFVIIFLFVLIGHHG
ncbi:MAG: AN1-type zinc finger domain-containing protein [Methanoregula sp.]